MGATPAQWMPSWARAESSSTAANGTIASARTCAEREPHVTSTTHVRRCTYYVDYSEGMYYYFISVRQIDRQVGRGPRARARATACPSASPESRARPISKSITHQNRITIDNGRACSFTRSCSQLAHAPTQRNTHRKSSPAQLPENKSGRQRRSSLHKDSGLASTHASLTRQSSLLV